MSETTTTTAHIDITPAPSQMLVNIINTMPQEAFDEAVAYHLYLVNAKAQEVGRYCHHVRRCEQAGVDPQPYQNKLDTLLADYDQVLQAHADLVAARR